MSELGVQIEDITEANLKDIPAPCSGCIYWEFPEEFEKTKAKRTEEQKLVLAEKKREWFVQTMKDFGTCGKIVYHEGKPVAFAQFAPSAQVPRIKRYESKSVGKMGECVVFLSCLYIADKTLRRRGLGETLLNNIIGDLKRRGFKAVETFARRGDPNNPSGPLEFYIKNGFTFKDKTNPDRPLMSLFL